MYAGPGGISARAVPVSASRQMPILSCTMSVTSARPYARGRRICGDPDGPETPAGPPYLEAEVTTMDKLNKVRLGAAALLLAFAAAIPLGSWIAGGGLETPAARAEAQPVPQAPAPIAPSPERDETRIEVSEPVIGLAPMTIVAPRPQAPKPQKKPCKAQDEGTRDLVQGRGTVRTFTFCH